MRVEQCIIEFILSPRCRLNFCEHMASTDLTIVLTLSRVVKWANRPMSIKPMQSLVPDAIISRIEDKVM